MSFAAGQRLGPYEIEASIAQGGMGEIYRGRDTRLDRTVAIKVIAAGVAQRADFLDRFEREARTFAALTHPHICTLYDVGRHEGLPYLVMEYLEGETLSRRLSRRSHVSGTAGSAPSGSGAATPSTATRAPLPLSTVLDVAVQIADALEWAHRRGIVHRDIKPSNVMLTKAGVKLLDFGLAKPVAEPPAPDPDGKPRSEVSTKPSSLTSAGMLIGTLPYMAPEQVEGRPADARSDIFSLAVLVYEMLTGQRPFEGKSQASLIAAILEHEPTRLSVLQPMVPPALDRLILQCLSKDPDERWQSAGDVKRELRFIAESGSQVGVPGAVVAERARRQRAGRAAVAAALVALAGVAIAGFARRTPPPRPQRLHLQIPAPRVRESVHFALSPDGRKLAYVAGDDAGGELLWLRPLEGSQVAPLPGTAGARHPFWAPDSASVAFLQENKLRRTSASGGETAVICEVAGAFVGGAFADADTILFAVGSGAVFRVAARGGAATQTLTGAPPAAQQHATTRPAPLPGGRILLSHLAPDGSERGLYVVEGGGRPARLLLARASAPLVSHDGWLVFARLGSLLAQRFDPASGALSGDAFPLVDDVAYSARTGLAGYSLSQSGTLVYRRRLPRKDQFAWFSRAGERLGNVGRPGRHDNFDLAADGETIVFASNDPATGATSVWRLDVRRDGESLVASDAQRDLNDPILSPDGLRVAFGVRGARPGISQQSVNGGLEEEVFRADESLVATEDWSPDGRALAFQVYPRAGGAQGAVLVLDGPTPRKPILFGGKVEEIDELAFSPDGRWLAYNAIETGRWEVYVTTNPPAGERWQISTGGGMQPRWSEQGNEVFFLAPDGGLMSAEIRLTGTGVQAAAPRLLWKTPLAPSGHVDQFAVHGDRFLLNLPGSDLEVSALEVIVNWNARLPQP
jgi:Tol biopolymer transport system component